MESFEEVLMLVKEYIKKDVSDVAFSCWIDPIEPVSFKDGAAVLCAENEFKQKVIVEQYLTKIKEGFEAVLGFAVEVIIATEENINQYSDNSAPKSKSVFANEGFDLVEKNSGNYEFTFETFIVGASNNFAYAACKAITNQQSSYNPLFIYSQSGLGKTHLLMAVSNEMKKQYPEKNILLVSSETFTNELIAAIEARTISDFRIKYRKADVLLIDDVQFISGKERTQEEFFHTFNDLYQYGKQIVLTSDRPPKDIKTLEDRLKSRFEMGLITDISPPDYETRIAIINRKAMLLNIEIPTDVTEYLAENLKTNIRQLEGAVKKIEAYKKYVGSPPSIGVAKTVIKEILNDNQPIPVTIEKIIDEVSKTYSVQPEDIRSKKRNSNISAARQISIFIVREITQLSMAAIGEEFGRDHSTIVYSVNQTKEQIETDPRLKAIIEDIIKNIKSR